jgi:hypothetical protein
MTDPAPDPRPPQPWRGLAETHPGGPALLVLAVLAWALAWMALEAWFGHRGVGPLAQALAPVAVCLLLAGGLALGAPGLGRRLAASRLLAGLLAGAILLALGVGWGAVWARGREVLPGSALDLPLSILATVRPSDLLRSLWLEALLFPLAGQALAVARAHRRDLRRRPGLGLLLTGPVLLAAAALGNRAGGLRATQVIPVGGNSAAFGPAVPSGPAVLLPGFQVKLESLEAVPREPAFRLAQDGPQARWTARVESGQSGDLPGGLRYQVERLIPDALPSGQVVEDPQGPENPAVQVMLGLGSAEPLVGVLFALEPEGWRRDEPQGRFAVVYRDRFEPALLATLRPHPPTSQKLVLTFLGKTLEHPVRPGGTWDLPGFSLTVVGIYPDLGGLRTGPDGRQELFSRSPIFRNPWLRVRLRQASGAQADLLLSARPIQDKDYADYLARTLPPGMTLRYVPEGEELQDRFVLLTREDGKVRLVEDGRVTRTADLAPNRPFIVEKGLSVTLLARYDRARFEPDFVPDPDVDVAAQSERPVLRLRVWDPATGAADSRWLQAQSGDGRPVGAAFLGGRIRLVYRPKAPDLRDLAGTLAAVDPTGAQVARGPVTVGDAFSYRGHRFYLDGWIPGTPASARLRLATDPGLVLAWVGLVCLVAGAIWTSLEVRRRREEC